MTRKTIFALIIILFLSIIALIATFIYIKAPIFFKPKHKVIQYKEEVKLSNGEMIWVDIKRHYTWSGYAPGMGDGAYLTGKVEISWDTGFEKIGYSSLILLDKLYMIDKIDDKWYVISDTHGQAAEFKTFHNCPKYSTYVPRLHIAPICLTIINSRGEFEKLPQGVIKEVQFNILNADAMLGEPTPAEQLSGKRLTWQDKITIQESLPEFTRNVGRNYQAYPDPKEYHHDQSR